MKLQINSLEALERLIGGDNEVELDLRNSVVQAFTNKHLRGLAESHAIVEGKRITEGLLKAVTKEAIAALGLQETEVSSGGYYPTKTKVLSLTADAMNQLRAIVQKELSGAVWTITTEEVKKRKAELDEYVADQIKAYADKYLKKKVDEAILATVREKLGMAAT